MEFPSSLPHWQCWGSWRRGGNWYTQGEGSGSPRVQEFQECGRPGALPGRGCSGRGAWFRLITRDLLAISSGCIWPISSLILQITLAKC